ncbi:MAG: 23S rRNA (adenine(2503)-C(2))-methyltransferase RlmN [Phycisphaerales bacterium]|nr:23S rRNA (adenine(2503)-C(2))-methyltransferase RlmN [Phycisphaerales bacterium]
MHHPAHHIFEFTPESLREWCTQRGMAPFRAAQVLDWVYRKGVTDPVLMRNLSKRDRETLGAEMTFLSGDIVAHQFATDGTSKLLIQWDDPDQTDTLPATGTTPLRIAGESFNGHAPGAAAAGGVRGRQTECVMIPVLDEETGRPLRRTACISSQVGCPVGCKFCASGIGGLEGNLSAGRIIEQVWRLSRPAQAGESHGAAPAQAHTAAAPSSDTNPDRISNVVFMGMGEPLSNFKAVTHAVRTIAAPWGLGISARKITISTVGLPTAIEKLAAELEVPVTLALSLHAPTDELRRQLIPWAEYTTIAELLAACHKWFQKTGREVTLEYTLLRSVNDRPEHAEELARVARSLRANVNLIRYNEVAGMPFSRPDTKDVRHFQAILRERGINAHIRRSRGRDIAAACGQLRHETSEKANVS